MLRSYNTGMKVIQKLSTHPYWKKIWKNRLYIGFFLLILWIFWTNTFYTRFPDEFDNIVGGWYIIHGKLPYRDFFSHHNPGAYYIGALITLFSRQSFVLFREIFALLLFGITAGFYWFLRKKFAEKEVRFYLGYIVLVGLAATYFWANMLLSETIVAFLFIPAFALFFLRYWLKQKLTHKDLLFISILTSISLLTSFTFLFAIGIFWFFVFIYYWQHEKLLSKNTFLAVGIALVPYILFLIYLLITGSLSEFIFQSIVYNRDYYIYNFPIVSGQVSTNPVRYAISIFYNTSQQLYAILVQFKDFNFAYPVNLTLALVNFGLIAYLVSKRKYSMGILIYLLMIYFNARAEPLTSKETDFHSTVYGFLSLFNLALFVKLIIPNFNKELLSSKKLFYGILMSLVGVYGMFTVAYFTKAFTEKTYMRFMGQAPGIYDEPVVAPIINKIVSKDDYFWIGPFEFQELLYINGKLPSKYHWFLPANERSEKIKTEIVADLLAHRPKLIVFKEDYRIFGVEAKDFNYPIVNFLREHYIQLHDLEKNGVRYRPKITDLHNFDLEWNFYFDKSRTEEIIDLLLKEQIIEPIE